jgi:two-component system cell cycle response regulator DivK
MACKRPDIRACDFRIDQQGPHEERGKIYPRARGIIVSKTEFLAGSIDQSIRACRHFLCGEILTYRILVVEDNLLNRELLRDWLEVEGFEVWLAADLTASYQVFRNQIPNAVLLDIDLGAENGLDLLKWMRQEPDFKDIPVIAVTAHALLPEQERILEAGCNACMSKPIDFALLRKQLNQCLQERTMSPL